MPTAASVSRPHPLPPARGKRVPDHQRRRAAVSCDHCKQRRAKCMRASPRDPCSNCLANHIPCRSTLPRKQRVYGSVESLSLRYRALEALVRGLLDVHPAEAGADFGADAADPADLDTAMADRHPAVTPHASLDLDALYRAAADRGIPMPPREDMTPNHDIFAANVGRLSTVTPTIVAAALSKPATTPSPPASQSSHPLPPAADPAGHVFSGGPAPPLTEKLIPTPSGVAHYVGASSSFRFIMSIRTLVAQCGNNLDGSGAGSSITDAGEHSSPGEAGPVISREASQRPATSIRDAFVGLQTSKALEPPDSGGDEGDEDDDDEGDDGNGDGREAVGRELSALHVGDQDDVDQKPKLEHEHRPLQHRQRTSTASPAVAPSPSTSRRSRYEYDDAAVAATFLPPRETADIFVRIFFDHVHPNYPLFHRGAFLLRYETLWQSADGEDGTGGAAAAAEGSSPHDQVGWNCCLAMVFAFGAQALEGHDRARRAAAVQRRCLHVVRASLGQLAGTTSLANVQALLLLQLYEHNAGQRNTSWTFLGCAARMAVALGMHRDGVAVPGPLYKSLPTVTAPPGPGNASTHHLPTDREARRRVWWTLYTFERGLCIMLGRPSALDEAEIAVSLPSDDLSADLPQGYSVCLLRLVRATWRIKQLMYPAPGSSAAATSAADMAANAKQLLAELDAWQASVPAHLQPCWRSMIPQHRRAVLLLHVQLQYARTLVARQYVLERATADLGGLMTSTETAAAASTTLIAHTSREDLDALADLGLDAAERSLGYLQQLGDAGLLDGVAWIDIYFVYHAVLVICLDLLGRLAAKPAAAGLKSNSRTGSASSPDAVRRRAAVRAMLRLIERTPMASTYRVLIKAALQFAVIVGACDSLPTLCGEKSGRAPPAGEQTADPASQDHLVMNMDAGTFCPPICAATTMSIPATSVDATAGMFYAQPSHQPQPDQQVQQPSHHSQQQQQQQQQLQNLQAFTGPADWLTPDLSSFSWLPFETTAPATPGGLSFFSPGSVPFGMNPDAAAFDEESYMQADAFQSSMVRSSTSAAMPSMTSFSSSSMAAASVGANHHVQPPPPQPGQRVDSAGWAAQAWRKMNTRFP